MGGGNKFREKSREGGEGVGGEDFRRGGVLFERKSFCFEWGEGRGN